MPRNALNAIEQQSDLLAAGPPRPERRRAVSVDPRRRILAAAAALYAQRGRSRLSAADISDLAGVPRRRFYGAFRDEADCLDAVAEDALERLADAVSARGPRGAAPGAGGGDRVRRLNAAVHALVAFALENPAEALVLSATANGVLFEPRLEGRSLEVQRRLLVLLRSHVQEEEPLRPERPIDMTSSGCALAMVGAHLVRGDRGSSSQLEGRLADLLEATLCEPKGANMEDGDA